MDITLFIGTLFSQNWFVILLLVIITLFRLPWFKGAIGECKINHILRTSLPCDAYHLLKNVTLPTQEGSTQIDHIVVSQFGIFVIETKNMKGWIFGSERQASWTQKIYKNSYRFQNPLRQNYKHTQTLATILRLDSSVIHSVIVFVGDSTFKTAMPKNVIHGRECIDFIRSQSHVLLSENDVKQTLATIDAFRLTPGLKTHLNHVRHMKQRRSKK